MMNISVLLIINDRNVTKLDGLYVNFDTFASFRISPKPDRTKDIVDSGDCLRFGTFREIRENFQHHDTPTKFTFSRNHGRCTLGFDMIVTLVSSLPCPVRFVTFVGPTEVTTNVTACAPSAHNPSWCCEGVVSW